MTFIEQVDGVIVHPDIAFSGFIITNNGRFVRLETDFGLVVESDGVWTSTVRLPDDYSGKMSGLCQNSDNIRSNDLTTSDGRDVTTEPNKYSQIGNSYQVADPELPGCTGTDDLDAQECLEPMKTLVKTTAYCGLLTDTSGPFAHCFAIMR